jgi:3-methyladenine DNA glycosylase/8-oxoguanine DNA glycosylase
MMNFVYSILQPFNLKATTKTHGWFQLAPFYWDEKKSALGWATKLYDQSPFLVHLKEVDPNSETTNIQFTVDKKLPTNARVMLIQKFRHIFNLDLDLSDFYDKCNDSSVLQQVGRRGMGRLLRSESVFEDVFKSICGTNIQWKQAVKIINQISQLGDVIPGTDYHLFPSPKQIIEKGEKYLKEVGRVGYRSSYLMDLANRFAKDESLFYSVNGSEILGKELVKFFLDFKGVGKVTARYLAALYGHFEDMAIDSLVYSYMSSRHFNGETPSDSQIEDFYAIFGEWKYLAYWMEFILAEGWKPED